MTGENWTGEKQCPGHDGRRRGWACVLTVALVLLASCTNSVDSAPKATQHSSTSTSTGGTGPTTTARATAPAGGAPSLGTEQVQSGPSGQQVGVIAQNTEPGQSVGGPGGSTALVVAVRNLGAAPFVFDPTRQLTVTDQTGKTYAPVAGAQAATGGPSTIAPGGSLSLAVFFIVPNGQSIQSVSFSGFVASPKLRWVVP
jgi:hypothetical protein